MRINYILASLALIGGISAAFTNHSVRNNHYPTWKYQKERIAGRKVEHISAMQLADLIYKKDQGFTMLDAREEEAYGKYHIPSALHYEDYGVNPDQVPTGTIIVYGSAEYDPLYDFLDEIPGKVLVLKGGIEEWFSVVLFPDFLEYQVRNQNKLEQIILRSRYFGGSPKNTQILNISVRESRYREGC